MSIISNLLPLSTADIIAVFDENGDQLFVGDVPASDTFGFSTGSFFGSRIKAQPFKAFVSRGTKGFTHPLENNTVITDHRIILPIEVTIKFLVINDTVSEIYKQIQDVFTLGQTVSVKVKAETFDNLYISSMPHGETPDKFDTLDMDISFTEIQRGSGTEDFNAQEDDQSPTVGRGELNIVA